MHHAGASRYRQRARQPVNAVIGRETLPICPRPLPGEAFRSWLCRVGAAYGMNAEELLTSLSLKSERDRLEQADLVGLSRVTRIPIIQLVELAKPPDRWTLPNGPGVAVCLKCLADDLRNKIRPHLRRVWQQAWYVFCAEHGDRLQLVPSHLIFPRYRTQLTPAGLDRINRSLGATGAPRSVNDAGIRRAIWITQEAISAALSGRPPHAPTWGILSANEFLTIIQDISCWALSNFEDRAAYPPIYSPPPGLPGADTPLFARKRRPVPPRRPGRSVRTLADVVNPAARCAALWWAYGLAADAEPATGLRPESEPRQIIFIDPLLAEGMAWLRLRMEQWPEAYVRYRWEAFARSQRLPARSSKRARSHN
ncbi:MAG: TniQ family protein [Betaproteobacteria bacterium]